MVFSWLIFSAFNNLIIPGMCPVDMLKSMLLNETSNDFWGKMMMRFQGWYHASFCVYRCVSSLLMFQLAQDMVGWQLVVTYWRDPMEHSCRCSPFKVLTKCCTKDHVTVTGRCKMPSNQYGNLEGFGLLWYDVPKHMVAWIYIVKQQGCIIPPFPDAPWDWNLYLHEWLNSMRSMKVNIPYCQYVFDSFGKVICT